MRAHPGAYSGRGSAALASLTVDLAVDLAAPLPTGLSWEMSCSIATPFPAFRPTITSAGWGL